jgi:glycosyltransferase involved in cell wall biosynthesis
MNVLALMAYYLPGFKAGGPVRSVANLATRLGGEIDFWIIAADRDLGDDHRYDGLGAERWQAVGNAQVAYLPPRRMPTLRLCEYVRESKPDVLYVNSFFNHRLCVGPLWLRRCGLLPKTPVVIAPRGEFSAGAMAIRRWKKAPYLAAARASGLTNDVLWHATSDGEREDIERIIGRTARIVTAPNLCEPSAGPLPSRKPKQRGQLRLAFLSRISPKKNLLGAIELLKCIAGDVQLDVWGPIEDASYWRRCQRQIAQLPLNVRTVYRGVALPDRVREILSRYDAMLFPTHGENFGHAIAESFAAACPVIISDCTPWRDLVQKGIGWDLPLGSVEAFRRAINDLVSMDETAHSALRRGAADFGRALTQDAAAIQKSRALFETSLVLRKSPGLSVGGRAA